MNISFLSVECQSYYNIPGLYLCCLLGWQVLGVWGGLGVVGVFGWVSTKELFGMHFFSVNIMTYAGLTVFGGVVPFYTMVFWVQFRIDRLLWKLTSSINSFYYCRSATETVALMSWT